VSLTPLTSQFLIPVIFASYRRLQRKKKDVAIDPTCISIGGLERTDPNLIHFNPLPPSDAVRQQKKNISEDLFSSVLSQLKNYHPTGNLKFNYLGISQCLKLRILMKNAFNFSKAEFHSKYFGLLWVK